METTLKGDRLAAIRGMLENWRDGRLKLAAVKLLLDHRRDHPELFAHGSYEPLTATGTRADQICAFVRTTSQHALLVVTARFPAKLDLNPDWGDTTIEWPETLTRYSCLSDLFTGRSIERSKSLDAAIVLADLPVAVMAGETPM
jgi:(1->4)-alpha-D-glucan 1-alpha-D-glucosylmutase